MPQEAFPVGVRYHTIAVKAAKSLRAAGTIRGCFRGSCRLEGLQVPQLFIPSIVNGLDCWLHVRHHQVVMIVGVVV
jgi:hypothetical protein